VLDPKLLAAEQLAALYAQRWEIEGAFGARQLLLCGSDSYNSPV
jgi:IS4 transposase